jgi:hypothetical protein
MAAGPPGDAGRQVPSAILRSFQVAIGLKPRNTLIQVVRVDGPLPSLPSLPQLPRRPGLFVTESTS